MGGAIAGAILLRHYLIREEVFFVRNRLEEKDADLELLTEHSKCVDLYQERRVFESLDISLVSHSRQSVDADVYQLSRHQA